MIAEETRRIGRLEKLQPVLVELVQRRRTAIDPIEQSKGNLRHAVILLLPWNVTNVRAVLAGFNLSDLDC